MRWMGAVPAGLGRASHLPRTYVLGYLCPALPGWFIVYIARPFCPKLISSFAVARDLPAERVAHNSRTAIRDNNPVLCQAVLVFSISTDSECETCLSREAA